MAVLLLSAASIASAQQLKTAGKSVTKSNIKGSAMYAWYFPWNLDHMIIEKGTWDGYDHTNVQLTHGIDFICQRPVHGDVMTFEYCADDDSLKAGAYIVQFADNYDGQNIKLVFTTTADVIDSTSIKQCAYYMTGDANGRLRSHKEPIYKFSVDNQRFEYMPDGKIINTYEAYIATTAANPVWLIAPNGTTGIEKLRSARASDVSVTSLKKGIYNMQGVKMQAWDELEKGMYIVDGVKKLKR